MDKESTEKGQKPQNNQNDSDSAKNKEGTGCKSNKIILADSIGKYNINSNDYRSNPENTAKEEGTRSCEQTPSKDNLSLNMEKIEPKNIENNIKTPQSCIIKT